MNNDTTFAPIHAAPVLANRRSDFVAAAEADNLHDVQVIYWGNEEVTWVEVVAKDDLGQEVRYNPDLAEFVHVPWAPEKAVAA